MPEVEDEEELAQQVRNMVPNRWHVFCFFAPVCLTWGMCLTCVLIVLIAHGRRVLWMQQRAQPPRYEGRGYFRDVVASNGRSCSGYSAYLCVARVRMLNA